MDAERWLRLSPLLDALLELEPSARQSSLASLREDDPGLAAELEQLLALEQGRGDYSSAPRAVMWKQPCLRSCFT